METEKRKILVTGDCTVDWSFAMPQIDPLSREGTPYQLGLGSDPNLFINANRGGAALLADLLHSVIEHDSTFEVIGPKLEDEALKNINYEGVTRAFSIWQRYQKLQNSSNRDYVYRMYQSLEFKVPQQPSKLYQHVKSDERLSVLVVDDGNLGFRNAKSLWPDGLEDGKLQADHVLLKTVHPLDNSQLWQCLVEFYQKNMTVCCSVSHLRKGGELIREPLSWEQICSDIVESVSAHGELKRAARVVVWIGASGGVIIEQNSNVTLVYDPKGQERDWERVRPGIRTSIGICTVVALASEAMKTDGKNGIDWKRGVKIGLYNGRKVHEERLDNGTQNPTALPKEKIFTCDDNDTMKYGFESVCGDADALQSQWNIISAKLDDDLIALAKDIVRIGPDNSCRSIPVEKIGKWYSVNRIEIEHMRSIRNLIMQFLEPSSRAQPLSLAVFGQPGSGKSFGIKQLISELQVGNDKIKELTFNLSQFSSIDDLHGAFQRIRDTVLKGKLPFVFWDEFDSTINDRTLGWLVHFLAPMQDGEFFDRGIAHPIGRSVFIFAGGVCFSMKEFLDVANRDEAKNAKATDFVSRLKGYVDILGLDRLEDGGHGNDDYLLRRALLLYAHLKKHAPHLSDGQKKIDDRVLDAFLGVSKYNHGARSMEAIVQMSALAGRHCYVPSALPPSAQLDVHVNAKEFLEYVRRDRTIR